MWIPAPCPFMTVKDVRVIRASLQTHVDGECWAGHARKFSCICPIWICRLSTKRLNSNIYAYARDVAYRYTIWKERGRVVLMLFASSVSFVLFDTADRYLRPRLGLKSATEVEMFSCQLAQNWAVCGTTRKTSACICGNAGFLARRGQSPLVSCAYTVMLFLFFDIAGHKW